jgi:hypothetical protein
MRKTTECYRCGKRVFDLRSKFIEGKSRWLCKICWKKEDEMSKMRA